MEADGKNKLPRQFESLITNDDKVAFRWENVAQTFYIQSENGKSRYLKIQPAGLAESLERQAKKLIWCKNKIPIPEVIDFGVLEDYEYLLTLELPGFDAASEFAKHNVKELVVLIAHGLRTIHDVSIEDCPFDNSINQLIKIIKTNHEQGLMNSKDIYNIFGKTNIIGVINELEFYFSSSKEDLVFTHGDYSMPNILINNATISGYIDLGNCGIADRYYDLAVVEKSIIRNYGIEYVELFFNSYGVSKVDKQRIQNYKIVEQLVWA
ncbi:aminoglycoside 3'-phosphotransferase [Paenibacillus polygoni]|uniref:Aminoglycoside 3'-phosphotransferase n=1 Tax=Paenibacillus polygoni TaxID=3050112 RepID=A0ABY8XB00_9BACL|nr:aminoglycoside 3'-phosphotransferase [Paenibacillus polygoni]WIV21144.1 aminoglycoside 3'-phosphotransferase [Paenibacillus polygoni]